MLFWMKAKVPLPLCKRLNWILKNYLFLQIFLSIIVIIFYDNIRMLCWIKINCKTTFWHRRKYVLSKITLPVQEFLCPRTSLSKSFPVQELQPQLLLKHLALSISTTVLNNSRGKNILLFFPHRVSKQWWLNNHCAGFIRKSINTWLLCTENIRLSVTLIIDGDLCARSNIHLSDNRSVQLSTDILRPPYPADNWTFSVHWITTATQGTGP